MANQASKKRSSDRTSYEVRRRWDVANQKIYSVRLPLVDDKDLIDYIETLKEARGTSHIFREFLELLIKNAG